MLHHQTGPNWLRYPYYNYDVIETPENTCPSNINGKNELTIAAILWDLADAPGGDSKTNDFYSYSTSKEYWDNVSGKEDIIFHIFDREIENANHQEMNDFVKAWLQYNRPSGEQLSQQDKAAIQE